jgi:hypothetical protein
MMAHTSIDVKPGCLSMMSRPVGEAGVTDGAGSAGGGVDGIGFDTPSDGAPKRSEFSR